MQNDTRNKNTICPNCFNTLKWSGFCPYCNTHQSQIKNPANALGVKTVVNNRYLIGRVLGAGGFGITYMGWDLVKLRKVTVKEFYPRGYTKRLMLPANHVSPKSGFEPNFRHWLSAFIKEAQLLARIKNLHGVIKMKDFFLLNNTAYIVADYMDGYSLREYINMRGGKLNMRHTLNILRPVFDSLQVLHSYGIIHKDISAENILVVEDRYVKLIDFGAAALYRDNIAKPYIVLKNGYSPIELYNPNKFGMQGPEVDVYQLGATVFNAITGHSPPDAQQRFNRDTLRRPSSYGARVLPIVENAIIKALAVLPSRRYQTIKEFSDVLYGNLPFMTNTLDSTR